MALTTQAYGLVKNKNHFSQGPQALLLDYISFLKCRLHTYSDKPEASQRVYKRPYRAKGIHKASQASASQYFLIHEIFVLNSLNNRI